jgi:Fe-S cluster assembly protein SufD
VNGSWQSGAGAFLARFEGLREQLPGDPDVRAGAAAAFRRAGLPTVREEAWKYTSLRPVAEAPFHEALTEIPAGRGHDAGDVLAGLGLFDAPRLVFVDGRFRADLSILSDRFGFTSFGESGDFGTLARPEREPLVALNTMLAEDGAIVEVEAGVDAGTVLLVNIGADLHGTPTAFHPRHAFRLAPGARLAVVEIAAGSGTYLHNPVTEIVLGGGARLQHIRLQRDSLRAFHLATIYAAVAAGAAYDGFTLTLGARVARAEIHAGLHGGGGHATLNAAQLLQGTQHGDVTTVLRHDAPACQSRQTVRNVLADRARGVFQGRIEVARGAQKTDGYQMNQALLLSPQAEIDSKPELEIYADDVKCSHGATVGELDHDQLFYLASRGIPREEARAILIRAFLADIVDSVTHEAARAMLHAAIETHLPGGGAEVPA